MIGGCSLLSRQNDAGDSNQSGELEVTARREIPYSEKKAFCFDQSHSMMAIGKYAFQKEFNQCMENAEERIKRYNEDMKESFRKFGEILKGQQEEDAKNMRIRQREYEENLRQKEALFDKFR